MSLCLYLDFPSLLSRLPQQIFKSSEQLVGRKRVDGVSQTAERQKARRIQARPRQRLPWLETWTKVASPRLF
jgi:hypothetical protein